MRLLNLSILFLIYVQGAFAVNFQPQPEAIILQQPAKKVFYSKGKGVFGLITGLTLGPVGYAAIAIFSHNRITRKKALLGMEIWSCLALSALIILFILKSGGFKGSGKGSGSKGSWKSGPNIDLSNFGTSDQGPYKRKRRQAILVHPILSKP
jgi:F0F1-type ATP synthase membrane subunit c/vacuolar-type H+-ATPase subunit K